MLASFYRPFNSCGLTVFCFYVWNISIALTRLFTAVICSSFIHANQSRNSRTVYILLVLSSTYCFRSAITFVQAASGHTATAQPLPGHLVKPQQVAVCGVTTGNFLSRLIFPFWTPKQDGTQYQCLCARLVLRKKSSPFGHEDVPPSPPLMDRDILCVFVFLAGQFLIFNN